ncbi:hypothetical protein [Methylobacterium sp. CM6247]
MTLEPYAWVLAVFEPRVTHDLSDATKTLIGQTGVFEVYWRIEEGYDYAGEWAMALPAEWRDRSSEVWVPSGDLRILKHLDRDARDPDPELSRIRELA